MELNEITTQLGSVAVQIMSQPMHLDLSDLLGEDLGPRRVLYDAEGRFIAAHSLSLPEPTHCNWKLESAELAVVLTSSHVLEAGRWVLEPSNNLLEGVRKHRNKLLAKTDWTQLPDAPTATRQLWTEYRQALRDITDQPDLGNIIWPTSPNA
jgi:hypothetical protein